MPLEPQMNGLNAHILGKSRKLYRYVRVDPEMYALPTIPAKPGLVRVSHDGSFIQLELWEMSRASFDTFTAAIPAPLGIAK